MPATQKQFASCFDLEMDFSLSIFLGDFMLNPETAMVKTTKNLERQQTFSYNLTIGAADHGKPSFSATVLFVCLFVCIFVYLQIFLGSTYLS